MSRYINVNELQENICKRVNNPAIRGWLNAIINGIPDANVTEVTHSEWHTSTVRMNCISVNCRNCHRTEKISVTNYFEYCPHCGAKMDNEMIFAVMEKGKKRNENA